MRVFKYRSNYGRDLITLTCNQLFASKYEDLNDPFESMQFMDPIYDESFIDSLPYLTNKTELKSAYAEVVRLLKTQGVYSLSKDADNEILWALYSDSHRGFAIEYETDILLKDFNFDLNIPCAFMFDIEYTNTSRVPKIIQQALNGKLNIQSIIGNKSTAWEKENELRITFEDWGLLTYNHTAVKSIIFGAKARKEDIKNTMNLLKGRGLKYKQIEISSKKYQLKVKPIEDLYPNSPQYYQNKAFFDKGLLLKHNLKEYYKYKKQIERIALKIVELPNILEIREIVLTGDSSEPMLQISCKNDLRKLTTRNFRFKYIKRKGFIEIA
ncbi:TPA: DUF2971 domain-containing protein [Elizabethkingia anophelis]|uniref:DUF2971 domain-containing protein n=1 Tax=Elizabethkingia TaxID=308865 RepID=UPI00162ABA4C|nr:MULTISPECIES: DUF2971 domain-containing protein [Elizabethkingia]MCT3672305.1 DUF2971 domain-containing protein [Elizabethkingia anophelis]MCT3679743.1 DUF2971 domain-containing protein [Elizabethkingia anophelis]MCT3702945.1 DUF2971 domain-containing protein [Elizabethkingia anophelis]MCT3769912.1 DUF2971 domain-containing protein [Elizabethkingia anophelis]MCT3779659.1 DUF2971 domain-containing protein [Elizabethkingia anophelis]